MALIENAKLYSGKELENLFFRPMVSSPSVEQLGIRVLYNIPGSTAMNLWSPSKNVLKSFQPGWQGGASVTRQQKNLYMQRVKAECAFDASDYFSMVYQHIINRGDVNMQDLSGTELEEAETILFKQALANSLRVTMWIGDTSGSGIYNSFDGILRSALNNYENNMKYWITKNEGEINATNVTEFFDEVWNESTDELRSLKKDGELAFYVSSDLYQLFENYVYDNSDLACINVTDANPKLSYRGIPLVDIGITGEMLEDGGFSKRLCILTDRRNLVLALNTADFPDAEVRMWYNPDQMENRQRAVFLAAADFIDEDLIVVGFA